MKYNDENTSSNLQQQEVEDRNKIENEEVSSQILLKTDSTVVDDNEGYDVEANGGYDEGATCSRVPKISGRMNLVGADCDEEEEQKRIQVARGLAAAILRPC